MCQLTLWISWGAVVWRHDERCWHQTRTSSGIRCWVNCGATEQRVTGCSARPSVWQVLGEKEAGGIAESIGWHQLRLALVGVTIVYCGSPLCYWVVLSWRSTGGIIGDNPDARRRTWNWFWGRSRGKCGGCGRHGGRSVSGGDRGWCISSCSTGGRSSFLGRVQFFVQGDISNVNG